MNLIALFIMCAPYKISAMIPAKKLDSTSATNALILAPQPRRMAELPLISVQPFKKSPSFPHLALLAASIHNTEDNASRGEADVHSALPPYSNLTSVKVTNHPTNTSMAQSTGPILYEHDAYDDPHDDNNPISPLSDDQSLSYSESRSPSPSSDALSNWPPTSPSSSSDALSNSPPTSPSPSSDALSNWLMEELDAGENLSTSSDISRPLSSQFSSPSNLPSPAEFLCEGDLFVTIKSALDCILQAEYTKRPPQRGLPPLSPFMRRREIVARTLIHTTLPRIRPHSSSLLTCIRVFLKNKAPITISNEKFIDQRNVIIEICADKTCKIYRSKVYFS